MLKKIYMYMLCWRFFFHYICYFKYKSIIDSDLKRAYGDKNLLFQLTFRKDFRALFYKRCDKITGNILKLIAKPYQNLTIDRNMHLGYGCKLVHCHTTHLHAKSIGNNFTCLHLVTIGNNKGGIPTIGDNVEVGVGACILGNITIGNNVTIGANAVVIKDIPDNCVVAGVPAKIIRIKETSK